MTTVATTDTAHTDTAEDGEPSEHAEAISWGPPEFTRLRSFGTGAAAGFVAAAIVVFVMWLPAFVRSDWFSSAAVFLGILLITVGPLVLRYWKQANEESTETEHRSFRERLELQADLSRLSSVWGSCGVVVFGAAFWGLWTVGGATTMINTLPMVGLLPLLLRQNWDVTTTVDPEAGVVEMERSAHTSRRSLDWAVDVRRFDLFNRSLFVFSNRGKRWYEGRHALSVPKELTPEVDPMLRRIADRGDSPPRIERDERLIIGAVGASMLAIGPLLYLLSGEGALLLIIVGPSALVAHFALLHAHRG